jgi:filamentous hemagglutinin family protein
MSEVKVNKITPRSGTTVTLGDAGDTVSFPSGAVSNSDLPGSGQITINGSAVALGGSITLTTETRPTFSSITPSTIENTQTTCTIAGGNFVSVPLVTAINNSTGATVVADEVSFQSASQITAKFTLPVDGTYKLYIENPDGNAVQTNAVLTVSDAPAWVTGAGSLGSFAAGTTIATITITATNATSFAVQSGSLPTGLSLNTGSGSATITGTVSAGITSDTLFSFTVRATDAEAQTADRAFTINVTTGANNSGQFN